MKKILLILTNITTTNMSLLLQKRGYQVIPWKVPQNVDYNAGARLLNEKIDNSFYGVMMYDYIPQFAEVCNERKVIYITWIVDCPHFSLYSKSVNLPYNYIFCFDRKQTAELRKRGVRHVYHLPLGTDVDLWEQRVSYIAGQPSCSGIAEVTFVGNLYNGRDRNLYRQIKYLPPYIRGYLEGILQAQGQISESMIGEQNFSEEIWEELVKWITFTKCTNYIDFYKKQIINMLNIEATARERCNTVSLLNCFFDFCLYTDSDTSFDSKIRKGGFLDYEKEMPLVFAGSKININITSRSIYSGIPLRILDIMACGGLVLTNYKEEIAEYFVDGRDCVIYYSLQDLICKINYYLEHEEERKKIAKNGAEKVKKEFALEKQLQKLCEILEATG